MAFFISEISNSDHYHISKSIIDHAIPQDQLKILTIANRDHLENIGFQGRLGCYIRQKVKIEGKIAKMAVYHILSRFGHVMGWFVHK